MQRDCHANDLFQLCASVGIAAVTRFVKESGGHRVILPDAVAGLTYFVPKLNNLTVRANIDYNRLTGTDDFNDFFSNYALNLSEQLGHASVALTLDVYSHVLPHMQDAAAETVQALLINATVAE